MTRMSFSLTFLILLSDEPMISQDSITSHNATLFLSKNDRFSSMVSGTLSDVTAAMTFQNRFWGCP